MPLLSTSLIIDSLLEIIAGKANYDPTSTIEYARKLSGQLRTTHAVVSRELSPGMLKAVGNWTETNEIAALAWRDGIEAYEDEHRVLSTFTVKSSEPNT